MALKIDKIARSIIFDLLSQAVNELEISEGREEILRKSIESIDSLESRIITITSDHNKLFKSEDKEVERHIEEIENLKNRISNLENFSVLKNSLMDKYKERLSGLEEQLIKNKQN
jgi:polyhydroxyalkanoate synthesis regulator phasin